MSIVYSFYTSAILIRYETEAQRKKSENGSRIWGSTILKEVLSSYEELSSKEVTFIHNIPVGFFY